MSWTQAECKTFSNGLMILGGVATVFPTASKPELRADWAVGPEAMIGYAGKKFIAGAITSFIWEFPAAPRDDSHHHRAGHSDPLGQDVVA